MCCSSRSSSLEARIVSHPAVEHLLGQPRFGEASRERPGQPEARDATAANCGDRCGAARRWQTAREQQRRPARARWGRPARSRSPTARGARPGERRLRGGWPGARRYRLQRDRPRRRGDEQGGALRPEAPRGVGARARQRELAPAVVGAARRARVGMPGGEERRPEQHRGPPARAGIGPHQVLAADDPPLERERGVVDADQRIGEPFRLQLQQRRQPRRGAERVKQQAVGRGVTVHLDGGVLREPIPPRERVLARRGRRGRRPGWRIDRPIGQMLDEVSQSLLARRIVPRAAANHADDAGGGRVGILVEQDAQPARQSPNPSSWRDWRRDRRSNRAPRATPAVAWDSRRAAREVVRSSSRALAGSCRRRPT